MSLEKKTIPELEAKAKTLQYQNAGIGLVGGIIGVYVNMKQKGNFARGVLMFFAGAIAIGVIARMAYIVPRYNKIQGVIADKKKKA